MRLEPAAIGGMARAGRRATGRRRPRRRVVRLTLLYAIACCLAFITVFPLLWMLITIVKPTYEIYQYPPTFFAKHYTFANFGYLLTPAFVRPFVNTVIVTVATTIISLIVDGMAAYALAKHRFPARNFIFYMFLASMIIPLQLYLIPDFLIVKFFGLLNTLASLVITWVGSAGAVFLMRQYMLGLPDSVLDAAKQDGASEFWIFTRVVVPMSAPVFGVIAIFTFFSQWNNLLMPLIFIHSQSLYTLSLYLVLAPSSNPGQELVAAFATSIPPLIMFLVFQRYFRRGVSLTGTGEQG